MTTLIGMAGMLCILGAFFLEEFAQHTRDESLWYNIINLVGALLLIWYSVLLASVPFLVLNVVWAVVAIVKLLMLRKG